jgi:hypothetical protein
VFVDVVVEVVLVDVVVEGGGQGISYAAMCGGPTIGEPDVIPHRAHVGANVIGSYSRSSNGAAS